MNAVPSLQLLHVQADDPNGESLNWFVVAQDHGQAIKLWHETCAESGFDTSDGPTRVRRVLASVKGTEHDGSARAIPWTGFAQLWGREDSR